MLKKIIFLSSGIWIVCLFSCSDNTIPAENGKQHVSDSSAPKSREMASRVIPDSLSMDAYQQWLKEQQGITYDRAENNLLSLSILYKPLEFEVAASGGNASEADFAKFRKLKEGYHHLEIECLDKNNSVTHKTNKDTLFRRIRENFFVVINQSDTIPSPIIEFFPAVLLNQPHKALVLVPRKDTDSTFQAGIKGRLFGLSDINIRITNEDFKSFPKIKI